MTAPKMNRFKYAATLLGAMAFLALAPATAHAVDNEPAPGGTGCTHTDAGGYEIPIDDGQDVFVDGKIVSCDGGKIVTNLPKRNSVRQPVIKGDLPVLTAQP